MSQSQPGPIRRFFVGAWNTVNFTRRLVLNLLFLLILAIVLMSLLRGSGLAPLRENSALVLNLEGTLVEQYTTDAISRAFAKVQGSDQPEFQLRDLLRAINAAKTDAKIDRILLSTDGFSASGMAGLRELGEALSDFRASGKQVIAYGSGFDQAGYYLASRADEIYMDPEGGIILQGLGRYRMYYREMLQDKLGVDVHLFRVGEFKSAAEPYILDGPSEESKQADLFWMNDLWTRYVAEVGKARKLPEGALNNYINQMPERIKAVSGDLAKLALNEKLVDGLKTSEEIEVLLAERGAADKENGFRGIDLDGFLAHLGPAQMPITTSPSVAVVVAQGEIVYGDMPPGTVGGESTSELIRRAREDDNVKALVLRVDSPGGGVFPSEQIRREVEAMKKAGKPVVVSMANVAASGGYWISMNADTIYADPSTITGSIGIFGLLMNGPRALEKIGIRTGGVGTTELAGAFDPTQPLSPRTGEVIQEVINHGYAQFIGKVAKAREVSTEKIDEVARGRVWSGAQAKQRGLVDELGGLQDAIAKARSLAKLDKEKSSVWYVEKLLSPFEQALTNIGNQARGRAWLAMLAPMLGEKTTLRVREDLKFLEKVSSSKPYQTFAHCLCDL